MDEFENYEFAVRAPRDTKNSMLRFLLILLYAVFIVAWLVFGFLTGLIPLLALIPVTTWILVFFTWRYVNVEYEYVVQAGIITFSKVFDNRSRKKVLVFDIRSAELIAPMDNHETKRLAEDYDPKYEYSFVSNPLSPEAFTALFVNGDNEKCVLHFMATPKLQKSCRLYNSKASKIPKAN